MINLSFKQIRVLREDQAREVLVSIRWSDGAICPDCGADKPYTLTSKPDSKHQRRAGLYKCSKCRKQFTVTVGTVFDGSRIKIKDWIMALYLMCSSKKGMSAHQLHRTMGVTYKTAWFMAHRIRLAMPQERRVCQGWSFYKQPGGLVCLAKARRTWDVPPCERTAYRQVH